MEREPDSSPAPPQPASMHGHAMEHLAFIRQTMERAGTFTGVSGKAQVIVGLAGLAAAAAAGGQAGPGGWLATWIGAAVVAALVSAAGIGLKGRATGVAVLSGPGRRFALGLAPPLTAGAVLTGVLARAGAWESLPPMWLLLYGSAVMAGGALSVPPVPVMGACFMALGVIGFVVPAAWGGWLLAAGFGLLHIAFGILIMVKHGG